MATAAAGAAAVTAGHYVDRVCLYCQLAGVNITQGTCDAVILSKYLEEHWENLQKEYNEERGKFREFWRTQLCERLNRCCTNKCNIRHISQYMGLQVSLMQQLNATAWIIPDNISAVLQGQYEAVGKRPSKKQLWDALDSVRDLSALPLTISHIEEWWRRKDRGNLAAAAPTAMLQEWLQQQQQQQQQGEQQQQAQQQPGSAAPAAQHDNEATDPQQQPGQQQQQQQQPQQQQHVQSTTGNRGAASFWYNKHPAIRDMCVAAAHAEFKDRLQQQSQQQPALARQQVAQAVLQQLKAADVLKRLNKQQQTGPNEWKRKLQAAKLKLGANRLRTVFESWCRMMLVIENLPTALEADPANRAGVLPRVD